MAFQLAIQITFSVVFLLHMTSERNQSYSWRNFLFWFFFIFICIASAVVGYLTGFGIIWHVVDDLCKDPDVQEELSEDECGSFVRGSILLFVSLGFLFNLYCSCKLREWAHLKRESQGHAQYNAMPS